MKQYNQEWEDLGRNIQDIIDRAVNSHDYSQLDQTIRHVVGRAVDLGSDVVRKAMDTSSRSGGREQPEVIVEKRDLPVLYGSTGGKTTKGIVKIVGGVLAAGGCGLVVLADMAMNMFLYGDIWLTFPIALGAVGAAAGALLAYSGIRGLGKVKRFKTYRRLLGQKTHITLSKLAQNVGKSVKFVKKDIKKMIDGGLFLEGHLDNEEQHLITSHETYQHYEQSRLEMERRQLEAQKAREAAEVKAKQEASKAQTAPKQPSQVQEVLEKGNAFIAEIRRCNDAIPGEEISAKIYHMEMIVQRIFLRAETNPEIIPDLKKLMDYYLPMTVKLLNAYADMDAQPIQGGNIENSKREIEATLDTLNLAFEKLLDDLFQDTAMDVSSDISVLKTLLAQEGLTEDELTKMKKQNI